MKTYTVKEIAQQLGTSEETVRRWIRTNRMKPTGKKSSNKSGFTVSQESLNEFLENTPKYMGIASKAIASASIISPAAGIATAAISGVGLAATLALGKKADDKPLSKSELKMFALAEIEKKNNSIRQKQELIRQIEAEIQDLRAQIIQYESYIENVDGFMGEEK